MRVAIVGSSPLISTSSSGSVHHQPFRLGSKLFTTGLKLHNQRVVKFSRGSVRAATRDYVSPWLEKPSEVLPNGKKAYLDELDILTFLDPPKDLIPLDPSSYNPAAYLWKKIDDIPEERRHRLLELMTPRLISRAWEITRSRFDDAKIAGKCSSKLLSNQDTEISSEFYKCRTSGGPFPLSWMNFFKKIIFSSKNGKIYGRIIGSSVVAPFADALTPLYFEVTQAREVMSTEEPCDLAYEFGTGLLDTDEYPKGFPKPVKHRYPFDDEVVIYIRHVGPGVCVGQAWQEGKEVQQIPQKLCSEILMVKEYTQS